MFFRVLVIALALLTAGCQSDPYAWQFTKRYPNERELVGTYRFVGDPGVRVILNSDKTFTYEKWPDSVFELDGRPKGKSYSGKGTWSVWKYQSWWAVLLVLESHPTLGRVEGGYGMSMMVIGNEPPYTLHISLGDPDQGMALQFKK